MGGYIVPDNDKNSPQAFFRVILDYPEFELIRDNIPSGDITIEFLFRTFPKQKAGRYVLGSCHLPSVQGELKPMFEWLLEEKFGYMPDFLILLDMDYWDGASELERRVLMFHELCHIGQSVDKFDSPKFDKETGKPCWCIVGHDLEEFDKTVARFGSYSDQVKSFVGAAIAGDLIS